MSAAQTQGLKVTKPLQNRQQENTQDAMETAVVRDKIVTIAELKNAQTQGRRQSNSQHKATKENRMHTNKCHR